MRRAHTEVKHSAYFNVSRCCEKLSTNPDESSKNLLGPPSDSFNFLSRCIARFE
jgi:hypothetical protein